MRRPSVSDVSLTFRSLHIHIKARSHFDFARMVTDCIVEGDESKRMIKCLVNETVVPF